MGIGPARPTELGRAAARTPVQNYLDAMKAKDAREGKQQLCAALQAGFDQGVTGPNGDCAVNKVQVDKVERAGNDRKVTTTLTATSGGESKTFSVLFTVQKAGDGWCISREVLAP